MEQVSRSIVDLYIIYILIYFSKSTWDKQIHAGIFRKQAGWKIQFQTTSSTTENTVQNTEHY